MLRYGRYARKSDDDRSVTEKSIGEQVAACNQVAQSLDLVTIRDWEESQSARQPGIRPFYKELISEIRAGHIDGILCWHINRLVRNMQEGGELVQLLVDGKIKEIRTPHAVYHPEDNILPIVIEAASAAQYSRDLSVTVKRSMVGNFERGNCNHRTPQGYKNARCATNLKRGTVEIDEDRFPKIRVAWDLMLSGRYSISEIVDHLNTQLKYRTRVTKKGGGMQLTSPTAKGMFSNPFYMGVVRYQGRLVNGNHEAMVTPDEFAIVQEILGRESHIVRNSYEHAFTGLMRCVHCGAQITADRKILRNGTPWTSYRCSDPKTRCTKRGIDGSGVRWRIAGAIREIRIHPSYVPIALEVIELKLRAVKVDALTLETVEREIGVVDERIHNLEEMGLSGLISDPRRFRELRDQEFTKREKLLLERARVANDAARMRKNAERTLAYAAFAEQKFEKAFPRQQGSLASMLADTYAFDGVSKRIQIAIKPILKEIVRFVRSQIEPIEPSESGSTKEKTGSFKPVLSFGGPSYPEIELPSALLKELRGPLFPEFPLPLDEAGVPIEGANSQDDGVARYTAKPREKRKPVPVVRTGGTNTEIAVGRSSELPSTSKALRP